MWQDEERWKLLKYKLLEQKIVETFQRLRENGIEPVLIKGWAVGLDYPFPYQRVFSDIDIAVDPKEFARTEELLKELRLTVDLHQGLTRFDKIEWEKIFNRTKIEKIEEYPVRVLCREDHLRVICVHWLMDGGAYKDKLRDVYYLIENKDREFDWELCLADQSARHRRRIMITIALAGKYFGLNVNEIMPEDELKIPAWILRTVEKEWENPIPLRPLQTCLHDRKLLFLQLKKRFPPNMIQATVELDGEFDDTSRIKYQLLNILQRLKPSFKRIVRTLRTGEKN